LGLRITRGVISATVSLLREVASLFENSAREPRNAAEAGHAAALHAGAGLDQSADQDRLPVLRQQFRR